MTMREAVERYYAGHGTKHDLFDAADLIDTELAAIKAEKAGSVVIPLDQWHRLVELAAAWNSGDCCAAIADDMAGIIVKIGVQHER